MNKFKFSTLIIISFLLIFLFNSFHFKNLNKNEISSDRQNNLYIGWDSTDITPDKPVLLSGQFHARVSTGVLDPVTATVLAIESGKGLSSEKAILISCDLVTISDGNNRILDSKGLNLRDRVRDLVRKSIPEINPENIFLNATHTHTAPFLSSYPDSKNIYGVELDAMSPAECLEFVSQRIAGAAKNAWNNRKPGGISYGLGHAVVGHCRAQASFSGRSTTYGNTNRPDFSHIEGYEDHSVNLLYTWNSKEELTGVIINVSCPSQVTEGLYQVSADFWHDTRQELYHRLGKDIHIFPQCGAAGDQSPHILVGERAEARMQKLMNPPNTQKGPGTMGRRKQIAVSIADAVTSVLPFMKDNIEWDPIVKHRMERAELTRRLISIEDVNEAMKGSEGYRKKYEQMLRNIENNPDIKKNPRWYTEISQTHALIKYYESVKDRYELEKIQPKMPIEIHGLRIADIVIVTNPFELYLDYGMRMKAQSPAIQTFIVQLTGSGSYVPTLRSIAGGGYGAEAASTFIGPEGGQELVEQTLKLINGLWNIQ